LCIGGDDDIFFFGALNGPRASFFVNGQVNGSHRFSQGKLSDSCIILSEKVRVLRTTTSRVVSSSRLRSTNKETK